MKCKECGEFIILNEVSIIQRAETDILVGTDLIEHKYTYKQVCKIIYQAVKENKKNLMEE